MKASLLIATLSLTGGLFGCQSLSGKPVEVKPDPHVEALDRIDRQTTEMQIQLQSHDSAIKNLEVEKAALLREQAALQCVLRSERAHITCMSQHSTLTDPAMYNYHMRRCLRGNPDYRSDLASCQSADAKLQ